MVVGSLVLQARFKRGLIRDIRLFIEDVKQFRADFTKNGPMVQVGADH